MRHTDYRTLIARGRKAGLRTTDIYSALSARPPEAMDPQVGQTDSNGFVTDYSQDGQVIYRPIQEEPR